MAVKQAKNAERAADDAHRVADLRRQARAEAAELAHEDAQRTHRQMHEHVQRAERLATEAHARDEESRRQVAEFDAEGANRKAGPGND
jgi:hypothetical protein